jgi:hypothetical protein
MKNYHQKDNRFIEKTISKRAGVGPNEMIRGWQNMLIDLLEQLAPYLKPARLITFQNLTPEEQKTFQRVLQHITIPDKACGVYLSPNARNQMLYTNRGAAIPAEARTPPDDGVLLFSAASSHNTVINCLLAHPPHLPAIDVYQDGALLAGYVYESIDACIASLSDVIGDIF